MKYRKIRWFFFDNEPLPDSLRNKGLKNKAPASHSVKEQLKFLLSFQFFQPLPLVISLNKHSRLSFLHLIF